MNRNTNVGKVLGCHRCTEEEICKVDYDTPCLWCGNNAVEEQFDSGEIRSLGAELAVVDDLVTPDSPTKRWGTSFSGR